MKPQENKEFCPIMVKIKDVADAAGVSTATVSRVLANKPHVRQEVKARVMKVVKKQPRNTL